MAKQQVNIRLDEVHIELLDKMVEVLSAKGVSTNRTDVIEKALRMFARENVLGADLFGQIIDKHYTSF